MNRWIRCSFGISRFSEASVKLPSGEIRLVKSNCLATIGSVGNGSHQKATIGKAGRSRWLGKRPRVRGVAMNPVDHPMGGEGKLWRRSSSPWGHHPRASLPAKIQTFKFQILNETGVELNSFTDKIDKGFYVEPPVKKVMKAQENGDRGAHQNMVAKIHHNSNFVDQILRCYRKVLTSICDRKYGRA